ncbi:hypothetical protein M513_03470 [Trichuris suis]|uniref:Uncharacterized protein n=1 Tax=Trichuris suis TaxID=68888 RepID=A0A085MES6_9BILA|nr:hypothetical protein M513_03470 [Trichuris suis]
MIRFEQSNPMPDVHYLPHANVTHANEAQSNAAPQKESLRNVPGEILSINYLGFSSAFPRVKAISYYACDHDSCRLCLLSIVPPEASQL